MIYLGVDRHEFQTRFLNHLISFLDSKEEIVEEKTRFKLYMEGQLGSYNKQSFREVKASRPLKELKQSDLENKKEEFLEALKISLILLKTQGHNEIASELISKSKEKQENLEGFNVSPELEQLESSFAKLNLQSNLEDVSYFIYVERGGSWHRILEHEGDTEIELPAAKYRVKCVRSRSYIQREVELTKDTEVIFVFEEGLNEIEEESLLSKLNPFS
ncbi:MAG: hypothetical protein ACLFRK_02405 [Candidatus Nanohaloarchaea archaeon]